MLAKQAWLATGRVCVCTCEATTQLLTTRSCQSTALALTGVSNHTKPNGKQQGLPDHKAAEHFDALISKLVAFLATESHNIRLHACGHVCTAALTQQVQGPGGGAHAASILCQAFQSGKRPIAAAAAANNTSSQPRHMPCMTWSRAQRWAGVHQYSATVPASEDLSKVSMTTVTSMHHNQPHT